MTLYLYETRFGNTRKLAEMARSYDLNPNSRLFEMDGEVHTEGQLSSFGVVDFHTGKLEQLHTEIDGEPVVLFVPTYENIRDQRLAGAPLQYASNLSKLFAQQFKVTNQLVGVVVAGNRTFGSKFCAAAEEFPHPIEILREVELFGDPSDWRAIADSVTEFEKLREARVSQ